jgi:hypothetical protein
VKKIKRESLNASLEQIRHASAPAKKEAGLVYLSLIQSCKPMVAKLVLFQSQELEQLSHSSSQERRISSETPSLLELQCAQQ